MIRIYLIAIGFVFCSNVFAQSESTTTTENATSAEISAAPATEFSDKIEFKVGGGYQIRIEKQPGSAETTQSLMSPSLFAQVQYREYQLLTEFEQVSQSSSEGNYSIQSKRNELLLIARYRFFLDERWALFAGLGAGIGKETVKTAIGNSTSTNTGDTEDLVAIEGGAQFQFHKTYFAEVAGRGLKLENFEPWILTFGLRLGARL